MNYLKRALEHSGTRLSYDDRWLVVNVATNQFEVYQRIYGTHKTIKLVETVIEEKAVEVLIGNE